MAQEYKWTDEITDISINVLQRELGFNVFNHAAHGNFMKTISGTGPSEIIGQTIQLKGIHWKGELNVGNVFATWDEIPFGVRFVVIKDTQPRGTAFTPLASDVWEIGAGIGLDTALSFQVASAMQRFKNIHEVFIPMQNNQFVFDQPLGLFRQAEQVFSFDINLKMDQRLDFQFPFQTLYETPENCNYLFFMLFVGGRAPNVQTMTLDSTLRARYTDS